MRTLAESLYTANPSAYAQYLDEGETGVTQNNYFRIASLERLGTAQDAQFQTEGQTGYWWGSKVSDDGNWTALSGADANNNAIMPRSYFQGDQILGGLYNWYGSVAESVGNNYAVAEDSICPKGWQLPTADTTDSTSWWNLIAVKYNLLEHDQNDNPISGTTSKAGQVWGYPFNFVRGGAYSMLDGAKVNTDNAEYISRSTYSGTYPTFSLHACFTHSSIYPRGDGRKAYGRAIRCVKSSS